MQNFTPSLRIGYIWKCTILVVLLLPFAGLADNPDFTRQIRPLLASKCFKCHGPDEKTRKARLRLDVQESAHRDVIVPGQPAKSELIARVFSKNPREVMPPPSTKIVLTAVQKELLKRWIKNGAKYEQHWAWSLPRQSDLPRVKDSKWPRSPIDRFVLGRLEKLGLQPSPKANRYTLIRRLSLDLIGLPPTVEEADRFVNDKSADAYDNLVDRLLASPHYGERWARRWLDLARYADTNGYEKDRPRTIWPYRDWVINAINDDLPFDQFTIEQLAGDLLKNFTPDQIIATGFHRNTMINEEGGVDPLEFRYYAMVDRVNTTAKTWLGLTLECAQCHSHKYDPISHSEYFQMMAFLNNADEPDYAIPDPRVSKRRQEVEAKITKLCTDLPKQFPGGDKELKRQFDAWKKQSSATAVTWQTLRPSAMKSNLPFLEVLPDQSVLAGGDQTKSDTYTLTFDPRLRGVTALRLEVLPHDSLPNRGPGRTYYEGKKGDFFLSELTVKANGERVKIGAASHDHAKGAFGANKVGAQFCYDGEPGTGWSTTDQPGRHHEAVFNFEKPVDFTGETTIDMLFERHYSCGLGRFRISVTTDIKFARAGSHGHAIETILAKPEPNRTPAEESKLLRRFLESTPKLTNARREIDALRAALPRFQTTMVMKERPPRHPRPTHRHHRGEYLQPKEKVTPNVPSVLHAYPKDLPLNRLGLAKWLVSPKNPLTARVVVNRHWQAMFGRGLVRTTGDFGIQGELPTHPHLLDWLAVEFVNQGWSRKKLHKMIVMSATYQQSSRFPKTERMLQDSEKKLLARVPRVRLEAELIRDSLLRASGLLSKKMSGPSVFPPQPASVTTEGVYGAIKWKVSEGQDRYRRGLYTFLKRSIPYTMFSTFDGATGETCLSRREASNTPLQALTMLNDTVVIECSQALGRKMATKSGTVEQRVTELFRRCLTRSPTMNERRVLMQFYDEQRKRLQAKELNAQAIAGGGQEDAIERAVWTLMARVVFNLDEMITKE